MIQLHPRSTRTDTLVPYTSLVRSVVGGLRLLFSGDLGPEHKAFHPDPAAPSGFDHIVCESTYGDQTRKQYTIRQRRTLLQGEIREAIAAGGNLVIPVFALEKLLRRCSPARLALSEHKDRKSTRLKS